MSCCWQNAKLNVILDGARVVQNWKKSLKVKLGILKRQASLTWSVKFVRREQVFTEWQVFSKWDLLWRFDASISFPFLFLLFLFLFVFSLQIRNLKLIHREWKQRYQAKGFLPALRPKMSQIERQIVPRPLYVHPEASSKISS